MSFDYKYIYKLLVFKYSHLKAPKNAKLHYFYDHITKLKLIVIEI